MMSAKRVYDLPTRVFHWLFAATFLAAFTIANTVDDDGAVFAYHMLAGMLMVFTVLWRIVWGFIGSVHARFSDFSLQPSALLNYLRDALVGTAVLRSGHNPASSWAAVIMMLLALGLGCTGYLMISSPAGESLEDVHEVLANSLMIVACLHVAGIILHTRKHKDPIGSSMLTGYKQRVPDSEDSVSAHSAVGLLVLALSLGGGLYLARSYDASRQALSIAGSTLRLQDFESDSNEYGPYGNHEDDD
jgi:cytochrome b